MMKNDATAVVCSCNKQRCSNPECRSAYYSARHKREAERLANDPDARERRDAERRRYARERYERVAEAERARARAYQEANRQKTSERRRAERLADPEKYEARKRMAVALRNGTLIRQPCAVGGDCAGRVEGHHDDYSKPLDVRWLCRKHHSMEHRKETVDA